MNAISVLKEVSPELLIIWSTIIFKFNQHKLDEIKQLAKETGADVFRFLDLSTKALEIESGVASNEPVNYAVRSAIEYCVFLLLAQGDAKGYWTIN